MSDYTITWGYIVSRMESLFGFKPDDESRISFGEVERFINAIWKEYFEIRYNEEFGAKAERSEE